MRVLHLIPSISPLRGGPSQAVMEMCRELRDREIDARILTTNDHGRGLLLDLPLNCWHDREGVPVLAFARWSPPIRPLREFAISPALTWWLWRHLEQFDLLHVHALFSYPSTSGMAIARCKHKPYVLRSIGQLNHWSLRQSAVRKQILFRLIERRNLEHAAAFHFTSEAEQQEAASLNLRNSSFVLPLGVTLKRHFINSPDSSSTRFLFLSRLHAKKQLDLLLNAFAALAQTQPLAQWQLDIAGDGDQAYVQHLQQLSIDLGLQSRCCWHGFVAGEAKDQLLQSAHWFVLPSASENFGIAAAEALAAGVPVILSPGVALADAVSKHGAGLVIEPTVEAWAKALLTALTPPSVDMRHAAYQLAAGSYSWPAIAEALHQHYDSILQRS